MIRAASRLALGLALLSGCASPPPPSRQARADQNSAAACRQRADQIYAQQNRRELFIGDDQRDTPFSANYVAGDTTRGLADEHSRDNQFADCVRASQEAAPGFVAAPSPPPPAASPRR